MRNANVRNDLNCKKQCRKLRLNLFVMIDDYGLDQEHGMVQNTLTKLNPNSYPHPKKTKKLNYYQLFTIDGVVCL